MRNFTFDIVDRAFDLVQIDTDVNRMGTSLTRLRLASEHFSGCLTWLCALSLSRSPKAVKAGTPGSESRSSVPFAGFPGAGYQRQQRAARSAASVGLAIG